MNDKPIFENQSFYEVPLLRLLYKLPHGEGRASDLLRRFEDEYGKYIPSKDYEHLKSGELRWEKSVQWSRYTLKERGLLDAPMRGVWRITDKGRRWIEENPDTDLLPPFKRKSTLSQTKRRYQPTSATTRKTNSVPQTITLKMLEKTRQSMPADQFQQVWGSIYDQLLAEERAKAITEVSQTELGRRAKQKLDEVQAYLSGRNSNLPRSDVLCDWIHFCYELALYREATSLLQYVREDEVDPGYYRRAKKWAEASRLKLGG